MGMTNKDYMVYQREKQRLTASEILQAMAEGQDVKLHRCSISGNLDVSRLLEKEEKFNIDKLNRRQEGEKAVITFSQQLSFTECEFEDSVLMSGPWAQPDSLAVVFKRDTSFNLSVIKGQCRFDGASFHGAAGFDGCKFERVASFRNVSFGSSAMFRTASFSGYTLLSGSVFSKDASFANTYFGKGGNFKDIVFKGRTNFSDVYSGSRSVPIYESVKFERGRYGDGEPFWRFIKQAAQDAGFYQLAGESFYNERCASLWKRFLGSDFDNLSFGKKLAKMAGGVRLLPEFVFGKMLFGYGERPVRVLIAAVVVILCCGLYYHSSGNILYQGESFELDWFDSIYFSTITFATLGLGDLYPAAHSAGRVVVMFESLSGASLVAMFIVSLAKRFSRG
ncbi:MAG: potassium channel family protein [Anaerohalosphaeraceae bacterium]|nr:potassium channel family protein [Anaerohalosphaeraceae bacterium]